MTFVLSEWLWLFALPPLWALATGVIIVLVIWLERATKVALSDALYMGSALGGLILASVGLVWMECVTFVELPFVDRVCRVFGYR
jgi:hypothetical protein